MTETPSDFFDVGFGWAVFGETDTGVMMQAVRRELGRLEPWQVDALLAGFRAGTADLAAYERDQAARQVVGPAPGDEVPF